MASSSDPTQVRRYWIGEAPLPLLTNSAQPSSWSIVVVPDVGACGPLPGVTKALPRSGRLELEDTGAMSLPPMLGRLLAAFMGNRIIAGCMSVADRRVISAACCRSRPAAAPHFDSDAKP